MHTMHGTAIDRAFGTLTTPTQWSAAVVSERLIEAFDFERQLPGRDGPSWLQSAWCAMPAPLDSFADLVHQGEAPARDPLDEVRDLLAEAIELVAVDLRCDTRSAAAFVACVLLQTPALSPPSVH
jgi:hypothetical protein